MPLHVYQRGNNRVACFSDAQDRYRYLGLLQELAHKRDVAVHAFVLMTNHVHLLLTNRRLGDTSWLMKNLSQRYAQFFNARHSRTGTLWEGRFHSSVVETERYFFTCQRYIELNPVRAGMVSTPGDYPWSSYGAHAFGVPSTLIEPHPLVTAMGVDVESRCAAYRALFHEGLGEDHLAAIRAAIKGSFVLGDSDFVERLGRESGRAVTARSQGRPPGWRKGAGKPEHVPGSSAAKTGTRPRLKRSGNRNTSPV